MNNVSEIKITSNKDQGSGRRLNTASHPSFGFLTASVVNCSQPQQFSSSRAKYDKYISMKFQTCGLEFDHYDSRVTDHRTIANISIAPHDFVRFISSVYTGELISVDINALLNTNELLNINQVESELKFDETLKQSLSLSWDNTFSLITSYLDAIEAHVNETHKLSAKDLRETTNSLRHAVINMPRNAEYGMTVWQEYFDKLENSVLLEVDGLLVHKAVKQIANQLDSENPLLLALSNKGQTTSFDEGATLHSHSIYGLIRASFIEIDHNTHLFNQKVKSGQAVCIELYQAEKVTSADGQTKFNPTNLIQKSMTTHAEFSNLVLNLNTGGIHLTHQVMLNPDAKLTKIKEQESIKENHKTSVNHDALSEYNECSDALKQRLDTLLNSKGKKETRAAIANLRDLCQSIDGEIPKINNTVEDEFNRLCEVNREVVEQKTWEKLEQFKKQKQIG